MGRQCEHIAHFSFGTLLFSGRILLSSLVMLLLHTTGGRTAQQLHAHNLRLLATYPDSVVTSPIQYSSFTLVSENDVRQAAVQC